MIYHGNRFTLRQDATPEQIEEALESLRNQGRVIPSVKQFVVGRDYGGEYEWGATFVITTLHAIRTTARENRGSERGNHVFESLSPLQLDTPSPQA